MKYSQVDWSLWDDRPEESTYNDWLAVRKLKRLAMTQTAINRSSKHINQLYQMGISADDAIGICCEKCWGGIDAKWVIGYMKSQQVAAVYESNVQPIRQTRDVPLDEQLSDDSWAIGITHEE